jgi:hypothetical protein
MRYEHLDAKWCVSKAVETDLVHAARYSADAWRD